MKLINLVGRRYGRLTVIAKAANLGQKVRWECKCDCGETTIVFGMNLASKNTKSCGCLLKEQPNSAQRTHGEGYKRTPEYVAWTQMKNRCFNPHATRYANWGGRGISVCKAWADSFETFLNDVGRRPTHEHSLDRRDNSKDYEPGNVRWATPTEQNRNSSGNRRLTYQGLTKTLSEWAELYHMRVKTLWSRIDRGWSVEDALETPVAVARKELPCKS